MRGSSGRRRRRRTRARITLGSLVPVIALSTLFIALLSYGHSPFDRKFKKRAPNTVLSPTQIKEAEAKESGYRAQLIAVGIAIVIAVYLLPGNPRRVERWIFPKSEEPLGTQTEL